MSRRARTRRDKRAEADELLGTDEDQDEGEDDDNEEMAKSVGESFGSDGPQVILGAYSARQ